jgi:hypothetical protein
LIKVLEDDLSASSTGAPKKESLGESEAEEQEIYKD